MNPIFSFGIMADCQYKDADDIEARPEMGAEYHLQYNYYRRSPGKLEEGVETFNQHDLAFVAHLGDFIESDIIYADVLHETTDKLSAPFWHVLGNHDFDYNHGDIAGVLDTYHLVHAYYSRSVNGYRIIVLDTNEEGVIENKKDSEEWKKGREMLDKLMEQGAANAFDWNGGLSITQLAWLDKELLEAEAVGERAIILAHHPVFPPSNLSALNADEILQIIDKHSNVIAFINGHHHCGGFGIRKGIPYLTVPSIINGVTNAFGIVKVYEQKIEIKGYGRVQNMTFELVN